MRLSRFLDAVDAEWPRAPVRGHRARFRRYSASRQFAALPSLIPGLSTENILALLNMAAASLEHDEVVVKIGLLHGLTLAGMAAGNPQVPIYSCDNFSRVDSCAMSLAATISHYLPEASVRVFDMDFRAFLADAPWGSQKVGVFFYDGPHTFECQLAAILGIAPHLADRALVIVDDTNDWPVRVALREAERLVPNLKRLLSIHTWWDHDRYWWNGVTVYFFHGPYSPVNHEASWSTLGLVMDRWIGVAQRALTLPFWLPAQVRTLSRSFYRRYR